MLTASLIAKKRDGGTLRDDEIRFMIEGFVSGEVADYQMSAFAMAVLLRGMNAAEIASLTIAMLESGERLPRDSGDVPRVDKHSTGGLGDKVSLVLAPLLACHDVHVPMISGRGLGLSGGTLDKLEAIPGFRVDLSPDERKKQLASVGCFIIGASEKIAPADRRLYALRDVTATVESVALITASILSKKLAASLDALVMDVKVGSAAFMKTEADAMRLAESIVSTGAIAGLPARALITDMDQPLGAAIGNAIEVNETLDLLDNRGPQEVLDITIDLSADVLHLCGRYESTELAATALRKSMKNGDAKEKFFQMISAQGGNLSGPLPLAERSVIVASQDGYVSAIDCDAIGQFVVQLGGGRRVTTDKIDPQVGAAIHVRIGDQVTKGQPLISTYLHHHQTDLLAGVQGCIHLTDEVTLARPLIIQRVTEKKKSP